MAKRPHPRQASNDPHDGPWTTCDRCGWVTSQSRMQFQYDYYGGPMPQNTGFLVCERCLDEPTLQLRLIILPPDPPPFFNTRPEPYFVDETNFLATQDGNILTTESGDILTPSIPNPEDNPNAEPLVTAMSHPGGSITAAYLDFFVGDPTSVTAESHSVLADITGSAIRTDVFSSLSESSANILTNTDTLIISASAANNTSVQYVAIYDAATNGNLICSARVAAQALVASIGQGATVQFDALGLSIDLSP